MKPWPSSSLAWVSLLTVFLFGFDGTFAFFGNPVNQLCANWKANAYQRYLAMGIISEEGGDSRFYAVSNDFEGFTVPADQLHVPTQGEGQGQVQGQERDLPYINLTNAQVLNVKGAQASWPQDGAHEKGAFILSFNHEGGFHVEDKFLAHLSNESNELLLVSLTKPDAQVERVLIEGRRLPPSRTVFSVDNKLSSAPSNADNLASMRILLKDETTTEDCILKYFRGSKHILYIAEQQSYLQHNQVKPEHAVDGGFLLNANNDSWVRFFQLSNQHHKIYLFYGNEEKPLEMPFADFLLCPEEESAPNGLMAAGIAVPVIVVIGTIFFCMSGKKKKSSGAKGSSTGSSTGAGKPTSKTGSSGKSRTPKK